ncbi:C-C motif chemokine 20-like [Cetorhinus maximus]
MTQLVYIFGKLTMALLMGLFMLNMLGTSTFADAQSPVDCCLLYSKKPLPPKLIVGYVRQFANELCDINAVIFYTRRGRRICGNPEDGWVKNAINVFLKKEMRKQ